MSIPVEKYIEKIGSRFNLVVLATYRVREIMNGAQPLVPEDNEGDAKEYGIALKEVATGAIDINKLAECIVKEYQHSLIARQHNNTSITKSNRRISVNNREEDDMKDLFSMIVTDEEEKIDDEDHDSSYDLDGRGDGIDGDIIESDHQSLEQTIDEIESEIEEVVVPEKKSRKSAKSGDNSQNKKGKIDYNPEKLSELKYVDVEDDS